MQCFGSGFVFCGSGSRVFFSIRIRIRFRIQIRIQTGDLNQDPPGSGSETLVLWKDIRNIMEIMKTTTVGKQFSLLWNCIKNIVLCCSEYMSLRGFLHEATSNKKQTKNRRKKWHKIIKKIHKREWNQTKHKKLQRRCKTLTKNLQRKCGTQNILTFILQSLQITSKLLCLRRWEF